MDAPLMLHDAGHHYFTKTITNHKRTYIVVEIQRNDSKYLEESKTKCRKTQWNGVDAVEQNAKVGHV